jgi:hypothetical protein
MATKTKTKTGIKIDPFQPKPDQPLANLNKLKPSERDSKPQGETPKINRASASATRQRVGQITPTDDMRDMLSRMRDIEADPDDPGYPDEEPTREVTQPVTPENLPAVIDGDMISAGYQNPEWHTVSRLPGNMAQGIRTMGRQLFRSFTRTPTDDIVVVANVMGMGPNTSQEINAVVGYLRDSGQKITTGDIDFDKIIPGYTADIVQYSAGGARFLVVRDQFGQYIYTWPESDSVEMSVPRQLK